MAKIPTIDANISSAYSSRICPPAAGQSGKALSGSTLPEGFTAGRERGMRWSVRPWPDSTFDARVLRDFYPQAMFQRPVCTSDASLADRAKGGPKNSTPHLSPNFCDVSGAGMPFFMVFPSSVKNAAASSPGMIRINICEGSASMLLKRCVLPAFATTVIPASATVRFPSTSKR
jgi:hypothetical protein